MPRAPRVHVSDGIYHVVIRGDNREPVFVDDFDRQEYLRLLHSSKAKLEFLLYAYALMTNHIHLLLSPGERTTISSIMHVLSLTYTKYFNRRYDRVGHLYQGRFHSTLVDSEHYLLEVLRYIHLNPMEAGMVHHPRDYPWTSYHSYLGPQENQQPPRLVDTAFMLGVLERMDSFEALIESGIKPVPGTHGM